MAALFALTTHGASRLASITLDLAPAAWPSQRTETAVIVQPISARQKIAVDVPQARSVGGVTLAQGWSGGYPWGGRPTSETRRNGPWWRERTGSWGWGVEDDEHHMQSRGTYRTLCVRLCDGFYWPISFATTPEHFDQDRRKCESSCGSPARLYVYRNPGGNPEDMQDLSGRPYARLKTAFAYRSEYNENCKCKSDPWQQEALDRHRVYALEAAKRKGDRVAAQQLAELKASMTAARRQANGTQRAAVAASQPGAEMRGMNGEATRTGELRQTVSAQHAASPTDAATAIEDASSSSADAQKAATLSPARQERMSLGARTSSPAAQASARPRVWRNMAESSP